MKAREPDREGLLDHAGTKIGWEVFGDGGPTLLLLPTWTIVHSRFWKAQVPDLARHFRVVTFDGPGNGRSDRPLDPEPYRVESLAGTALAVMEATATSAAVLLSLSKGANVSLKLAAEHPDRVLGQVFIGPTLRLTPLPADRADISRHFLDEVDEPQGWRKYNANHWRADLPDFAEFFFSRCFPEPHSTKQREDAEGWARETSPEVLVADAAAGAPDRDTVLGWCRAVASPVLAIHGTRDHISPPSRSEALVAETGGELVLMEGSGHIPLARDPVKVNLLVRDFVHRVTGWRPPPVTWTRGRARRRRALYLSSPIGLGHVRRDLATVRALRRHHPDLEVDWLAQPPVSGVLEDAGERVHPASRHLASESDHVVSESGEHDLHVFEALRRMDEILVADFMVFHDVVTATDYDLVVADEAWEVDHFLHENPELKRFAYAWSTDFVGYLPMPDADARERHLTADYNAEMIEHIARHPRVRDLAWFVGDPEDVVDEPFGPGLPRIREWTEQHYTFTGWVGGFDPPTPGERAELRAELGYQDDELVCIVTVGGSGIGADLLRRAVAALPEARTALPQLRMVAVTGPRIDPASLPAHDGLDVRGYVPDLHRHLAGCDLAVVQGGLTTSMELVATGTPFVYVPLRHHFEQHHHVHHRLRRHGAGRRLDYDDATPDRLADVIQSEIGRRPPRPHLPDDGAERAAVALAELI